MTALDAVGLAHRAGDHVQVFSGGQAQRVLIARALVRSPELLILDEPLAGIDRASRESLAEILLGLRERGLTLVTVLPRSAQGRRGPRSPERTTSRAVAGTPEPAPIRWGT